MAHQNEHPGGSDQGARAGGRDPVPAVHAYDDEISLRELYLILKRALPWIIVAAILVGAVTYSVMQLRTPSYEATAAVIVSPAPVRSTSAAGEAGLMFDAQLPVDATTYERIAFGDEVLAATVEAMPDLDFETDDPVERFDALRDRLSTEPSADGAGENQLIMLHRASDPEPQRAAELADAWAEATLASVRSSFLDTLGSVAASTSSEVEDRRAALREAESALRDFRASDPLGLLEAREMRLTNALADGEMRLEELERDIAIRSARRDVLDAQLDEVTNSITTSDPTTDAFLAGLSLDEARGVVEAQLAQARERASAAEEALSTFDVEHDLDLLELRIEQARESLTEAEARRREIDVALPSARAAADRLQGVLDTEPARLELQENVGSGDAAALGALGADPSVLALSLTREVLNPVRTRAATDLTDRDTELATLEAESQAVDRQASELSASLADLRAERTELTRERARLERTFQQADERLAALLERSATLQYASLDPRTGERVLRSATPEVVELQELHRTVQRDLAELETERASLREDLDTFQAELDEVQARRADAIDRRDELQREVEQARSSFDNVAELEPTITYLTQLTSSGARMLASASVPTSPTGTSALLATLLAMVVTGMLATLLAFLREAVRPPEAG